MSRQKFTLEEQKALVNDILDKSGWEGAWKEGTTPWDFDQSQPALIRWLKDPSENLVWPQEGKALVAGCGRGYDALTFANMLGLESWGVDISPTAVIQAKEWLKEHSDGIPQEILNKVSFHCCDFFNFEIPGQGFHIAYDFTFFCALSPTLRTLWGKRYSELITSGGYLITVMWPFHQVPRGPPFMVKESDYDQALMKDFVLLKSEVSNDQGQVRFKGSKIAIWKRK